MLLIHLLAPQLTWGKRTFRERLRVLTWLLPGTDGHCPPCLLVSSGAPSLAAEDGHKERDTGTLPQPGQRSGVLVIPSISQNGAVMPSLAAGAGLGSADAHFRPASPLETQSHALEGKFSHANLCTSPLSLSSRAHHLDPCACRELCPSLLGKEVQT